MLFPAYFKAFLAPKPVNSLKVYQPAFFLKLDRYSAIAIPWMLYMQNKQILYHRFILIRQFGLIPLGTSGLL
jgi:hypothetical protein